MCNSLHNRETRGAAWRAWLAVGCIAAALSLAGCFKHSIDIEPTEHTVKIEPIYMTLDINLRVQQELDAFYSDVVGQAEAQPQAQADQGEE